MVNKTCRRCGGNNLISDRSLGGRIVCARCGSSSFKSNAIISRNNKSFLYLLLFLFIILLIIL